MVLLPLQVLRPRQAISENLMDTSAKDFRRNRAALLFVPLIVVDAVVIGIAVTFEIRWLTILSLLAVVAMVVVVALLQRVDAQRRRAAGQPVGLELGKNRTTADDDSTAG